MTINKANAVPATVTANNCTYDGAEKPLVTVTGTASGGTMQYALGTTTEATQPYTTSIPAATDAGTYYVWYKVVGDEHHADTEPACITVTIAEGDKPAPVQDIYVVTEGADSTWAKGSGKELRFTFKRTVDDDTTYKRFIGIEVNGTVVDLGNYTATAGSVKIALKPSYLETLAVSEHVLTALFDDGSVDVKFTVTAAPDPSSSSSSTNPPSSSSSASTDPSSSTSATSATTTSSKASASSKATTPSTGDAIPIALIAACAALGAMALFVSRVRMRRQADADKHDRG